MATVRTMRAPNRRANQERAMSLVFYYAPMSTASITELVLEELGLPCEKVKIDLQQGGAKKPEFLKLNPNAKVPVLVHDGTPIWESAAITMYLGELFGVEKKLYPAPGPKRGEAMKWIVWTNVTLGDAVGRFTRNTMSWGAPAEQQNAKAGEAARADIGHCLRILDDALVGKKFLVGDYTLADAHLGSLLSWVRHMQIDFTPYANVNAWTERWTARPAVARLMAQQPAQ
jgi:glutathione S-transferase